MNKIKNFLNEYKYIIFILLGISAIMTYIKPCSPDVYWHIKNGESILTNGIPFKDTFSYWDTNFVSQEWLFDVFSYIIYNILGYHGCILFANLLFSAAILISFAAIKGEKKNIFIPFISIIILLFSNIYTILMRPHLISFLIIAIIIYILEKNKNIFWIPILSIIYVNCHGGVSILIPVVFLIYIVEYIYENWGNIDRNYLIKRLSVFVLIFVGFAINPYGIGVVTYGFKMPQIQTEYAPLIIDSSDILPLLIILIPIACMCFTKKAKLIDILMLFMGTMAGLLWIRMIELYLIIYVVFGAKYVQEAINIIYKKFINKNINYTKILTIYTSIFSIIFILISGFNIVKADIDTAETTVPEAFLYAPRTIVQYIKENNLDVENNIMLNHYNFGGYFIFHDIPVFIDGRCEPYLEEYGNPPINKDYEKMIEFNEDTLRLMDEYNVKYIATYKNEKLSDILIENNYAKELVSDDNVILLEFINGGVTDE